MTPDHAEIARRVNAKLAEKVRSGCDADAVEFVKEQG